MRRSSQRAEGVLPILVVGAFCGGLAVGAAQGAVVAGLIAGLVVSVVAAIALWVWSRHDGS